MTLKVEQQSLDQFYNKLNLIPSIEGQLMYWIKGHLDPNFPNPLPNRFLKYNGIELYVRKKPRNFKEETLMALDIANIILPEEIRGKLWFTNFLLIVQKINPWPITFVESVSNRRLVKFLLKKGWIKTGNSYGKDSLPSFYKNSTSN